MLQQRVITTLHQDTPTIINCGEDFAQIDVQGNNIDQTKIGLSKGKWLLWIGENIFGNNVIKSEKVEEGH